MEEKIFTSVEEECSYWKEKCLKITQERNDCQREFDDFTEESRQLEAELEMTVEQQEKKIRDLNQFVNQLKCENDSYKRKVQNAENESNKIDTDFKQLFKENEQYKSYIRELEQKNDDLERANRVATESVVEFESMLNQAYEKNALLELEVDEKERMQIKLQRLMDEARDLKQELKVRHIVKLDLDDSTSHNSLTNLDSITEKQPAVPTTTTTTNYSDILINSKIENLNNNLNQKQQSASNSTTAAAITTPTKIKVDLTATEQLGSTIEHTTTTHQNNIKNNYILERNGNINTTIATNNAMAPSDRVSTLNIVADLLRRLDNMEAKLKAWKIRKPSSRTNLSHRHNSHLNNHLSSINHLNHDDSNLSLNSIGSGSDRESCCNGPFSTTIGTQTQLQKNDLRSNT